MEEKYILLSLKKNMEEKTMGIKKIPKEKGIDNSLHVLTEGYLFISNRSHAFGSDIFETHLLGENAICLRGASAAELFYDNDKFKREHAAPKRVVKTLFGNKGVQTLDGEEHVHRKKMFMSLMTPSALKRMKEITRKQWEFACEDWKPKTEVILYNESLKLLCRAACEWTGVPLEEKEVEEKTKELACMFESPAAIGPSFWKGKKARSNAEKWIGDMINSIRNKELSVPEENALYKISMHRTLQGELLETETAAVEVINILRPIVAIAIYITFNALALYQHPQEAEKLSSGNEQKLQQFVQEVRRFYPFFPFIPARVKEEFSWNDYIFPKDTLTLLDIYGTNHHPELWSEPDLFLPDRFIKWRDSPFSFIPQGGGDHYLGHRCAGEWMTLEIMKESLDFLANAITYDLPTQDFSFRFNEMPALPHSKIIIKNIRKKTKDCLN